MKTLFFIVSFSLMFSITFPVEAQVNHGKKCLIVAIGDYKYLKRISSENDIPLIKSALEKQGFKDFRILENSQATKKNILAELTKLEKDTKSGDIVVIHFSAHGQGIPDDNGDEPDGVDESICCYGAEQYLSDTYKGEEHLRDDLLGEKLDKIREKAGAKGQVLVLLDACFSGSGTRGEGKVSRGVGNLLMKKGSAIEKAIKDGLTFGEKDLIKGNGKLSPMTVYSAARADELNYEYLDQGSLSYAFNKSLTSNTGKEVSYRSLFAGIISTMSTIVPYQNPVAEGEGIDLPVFGEGLIVAPDYFNVLEFDREKNLALLSGGKIAGIYPSSKIAFYKAGITDTTGQTLYFTGEVVSSGSLTSIVKLQNLPAGLTPQGVWCWLRDAVLPLDTVKITIKGDVLQILPKGFLEDVKKFKLAKIIDKKDAGDLSIEKSVTPGLFKIVSTGTGTILLDETKDEAKLKKVIKNFTKARLFESMNFNYPDITPGMELIPVRFDKEKRKITDTLQIRDYFKDGVLTVGDDDYFMLKISNSGERKAFFNIVSIEEDSRIMLLIPWLKKNESPANYFIEPGEEFIIPNFVYRFRNKSPFNYTSETIKIIFTLQPLDLRYAFMRSAGDDPGNYGGNNSILEEIMRMDDGFMSRGALDVRQDEKISTFTITIRKKRL
ncbi:MAG: caspase family protein [Ignavibacteria bacterium]|nr:caspase family protein [Ignavibacteria bacterium]